MLFIDSNIPMYLVGAPHPHKNDARRLLEDAAARRARLVTDAEVFQEILHRFTAIDRREAIAPAFEVLHTLVDEVFVISDETVEKAKDIVLAYPRLSARDAVHVASMELEGIDRILSFDKGFDVFPKIKRLS